MISKAIIEGCSTERGETPIQVEVDTISEVSNGRETEARQRATLYGRRTSRGASKVCRDV